jgi:hypothetical protein
MSLGEDTGISNDVLPAPPDLAAYQAVVDPPTIKEPLLNAVREYWRSKCAGRRMPRRADLDVLEMRAFMGSMFLFDVIDGGRDFRFRLIGTHLVEKFGRDSTGKTFNEVYSGGDPGAVNWLRGVYERVATEAVPIWSRAPLDQVGRDFVVSTAIHLPLSADGATVNMIFGASTFDTLRKAY